MKKQFVLLISILICASLSSTVQSQEKNLFMTRDFTASSIKQVEASTAGGSITVTGDAGSKAVVEVYTSGESRSMDKIKQILDEYYTIDIKAEGGTLYVSAKQKKNIGNWSAKGFSISFKISVPNQVGSNLQTSGGSISISKLSGSQNFKTSGGSLTIDNVSGNIAGLTSGGSINVTYSKDNIDLQTSGGSITAKNCSGKINLKTSGGSLNLNTLSGNIKASTSGGSVKANDIHGTLETGTSGGSMNLSEISGNVDAHTSGGSIDVNMKSVSEYVKLSNSGNISLNLPAAQGYKMSVKASNKVSTSGLKDFRGKTDDKSMEGTVGNGGPEINVKSSQQVRLSFE